MANVKAPPLPQGIGDGIIILTRETLEDFRDEVFAAGVARGRYETEVEHARAEEEQGAS